MLNPDPRARYAPPYEVRRRDRPAWSATLLDASGNVLGRAAR